MWLVGWAEYKTTAQPAPAICSGEGENPALPAMMQAKAPQP